MINRLLAAVAVAAAFVPVFGQGITYQGRLTSGGAPMNGTVDLELFFWSQPTSGTFLGSVIMEDVIVQNGLFTTNLPVTIESLFFTGQQRYMEVRVRPGASTGLFTGLSPRVAFGKAPVAVFSEFPWRLSGDNVFYAAGNVGIGDATPAATLTVGAFDMFQVSGADGSVRFRDPFATLQFPNVSGGSRPMITMFETGAANARRAVLGLSPASPNWGLLYDDTTDRFHFNSTTEVVTVDVLRGRLGIRNADPSMPLSFNSDLGGKISLWGSGPNYYGIGIQNSALQIHTAGQVDSVVFGWGSSTVFNETMRVSGNGNVFIGTTTPSGRLTVSAPSFTSIFGVTNGSTTSAGAWGFSTGPSSNGIVGQVNGPGLSYAVWGRREVDSGLAGYFSGPVQVVGSLAATGTKPFKIDHPLDPQNRYLYHYSLESPEVLNVYRGDATFGPDGTATVELPEYFEAINTRFQYVLTAIGAAMPNLHVAEEIEGRTFRVAGGVPGKRVNWMVTAQRNDRHVQQHGAPVEEWKPEELRGTYQDATLFGLPQTESEAYKRAGQVAEPTK